MNVIFNTDCFEFTFLSMKIYRQCASRDTGFLSIERDKKCILSIIYEFKKLNKLRFDFNSI